MYKVCIVFFLCVFFSCNIFADDGYTIIKFNVGRSDHRMIFRSYDLNVCDAHINPDNTITALIPVSMFQKVKRDNVKYTVIEENADNLFAQIAEKGIEASGYHTYESAQNECLELAQQYSDICRYEVVGKSIEGRDIFAIKISDNPDIDEDEPSALYIGMHHAREWISVEVPMGIAQKLCTSYGSDPVITDLVNDREIWILPIQNPDGFIYSQENYRMWRKNRRDNGDGKFGVDPNRNYGYEWGNVGASSSTGSDTYHGTGPFSEPCNQVVKKFAEREKFTVSLSYHSHGQLILWPWSYTSSAQSPQNELLKTLAFEMAELNGYSPKQSSGLYPSMGDYDDFMHGVIGTLSFTVELATQFIPSESQIPSIVSKNVDAALHLLKRAGNLYPVASHEPLVSTIDSSGPYTATVKLDTEHHSTISVSNAQVFYSTGGFYSSVSMERDNEILTGDIPGASYESEITYYIELDIDGHKKIRFPEVGEYTFSVCAENVLIVDNDNGKKYEKYFIDAINALGSAAVTVIDNKDVKVTKDMLEQYTAVVWITGSKSSAVILPAEKKVVEAYVAQGGSLFVTGQDFGYALQKDDFMKNVLKTKYVDDNAHDHSISGKGMFEGIEFAIKGGDGASNQSYPDVLEAYDGVETILSYSNGKCAATAYSDTGKVVYFGFGFEAISTENIRFAVMKKVMEFLAPDTKQKLAYLSYLDRARMRILEENTRFNTSEYMNLIGRQNFISDMIIDELTEKDVSDIFEQFSKDQLKIFKHIIESVNIHDHSMQ